MTNIDNDNDNKLEKIKIAIFGESSVGKTHFSRTYTNGVNSDLTLPTVGIDSFCINKILSNGKKYKIIIYDTAGQERYRSLSLTVVRRCDGIILMYDITKKNTYDSIKEWYNSIYEVTGDINLILIGNKCDLKDKRVVSEEEGLKEAQNYKISYFETSAKDGINVEKSLDDLIEKIIAKKDEKFKNKKNKKNEEEDNKIQLDARTSIKKNRHKCCGK